MAGTPPSLHDVGEKYIFVVKILNKILNVARGVTLLPITRVLASITRLAITRHGYEKHFILAEYLGSEYPGSYVGNPGHGN